VDLNEKVYTGLHDAELFA